jgi:hypothetical protein
MVSYTFWVILALLVTLKTMKAKILNEPNTIKPKLELNKIRSQIICQHIRKIKMKILKIINNK